MFVALAENWRKVWRDEKNIFAATPPQNKLRNLGGGARDSLYLGTKW